MRTLRKVAGAAMYGRALALAVVMLTVYAGWRMAQAQNTRSKPLAAVYIIGNPAGRDALRMAVNTFLVKSGMYQMVAVDAIDVVAKEHSRQMGGSVSDAQIAKLGQDAGAQYVCVVERTELGNASYVATRMVSVESKVAEFADMVKLTSDMDIIEVTRGQIASMLGLGKETGAKQTGYRPPATSAPAYPPSAVDGSGVLTDGRDGNKYGTTVIGGKRWMTENLNYLTESGKSWCYGNDNFNCAKYGRLYDWNTATGVCPPGWHLPFRGEWGDLSKAVGGTGVDGESGAAGKNLKSKTGWNKKTFKDGNGTDGYGFSALPGGHRNPDGLFNDAGDIGIWWTATALNKNNAYGRGMQYADSYVKEYFYNDKNSGFSVRCVEDGAPGRE